MKKFTSNNKIYHLIGILFFFIIWQLLSSIIGDNTFIFPGPIVTIKETINLFKYQYIYECIYLTISRMLIGFCLSFIIAFILGIFAGNNKWLEEVLKPTITVLRSIPTACLIYLFLVVVGANMAPLLIVILISLPILYEAILKGIKSAPEHIIKAAKVDGANIIKRNIKIYIPLSIPYIIVGIVSSFGLSLKIEIMAEVITGYSRLGLGSAIMSAQRSDPTNMVPVFAYGFVAIMIMLIIDLICDFIKQKYIKKEAF